MSKKKWIIIGAFVIVAIILVVFNSKKTATDEPSSNTPNPNKEKGKGNTTNYGNNLPEGENVDQDVCYMTNSEIKKLADYWYGEVNHALVDNQRVDNIFNSLKNSKMRTKAEFWAVLQSYSRLYERWFTCVIDQKADRMIANQILASKGIDVTFTDNKIK